MPTNRDMGGQMRRRTEPRPIVALCIDHAIPGALDRPFHKTRHFETRGNAYFVGNRVIWGSGYG